MEKIPSQDSGHKNETGGQGCRRNEDNRHMMGARNEIKRETRFHIGKCSKRGRCFRI